MCFIAFYLIIWNCYQDKRSTGWTFYAFACIGLASMVFMQIGYFMPILWTLRQLCQFQRCGERVGICGIAQLGRLQNAVIYRALGVVDSLIPDDGKIIEAAMIPAEGSEAEVCAHDGVAAAGQAGQILTHLMGALLNVC